MESALTGSSWCGRSFILTSTALREMVGGGGGERKKKEINKYLWRIPLGNK